MMKIREGDKEFRKYDMMNDNFDTEIIEKKFNKNKELKRERKEEKK